MNKLIDSVIETVITDEALHLAHEAAEPTIDEAVSGLDGQTSILDYVT